jgi:tRNA G10  N-methylase Trm11
MEYLVRFVQVHESFRLAELKALAVLHNVKLDIIFYSEYVCSILNPISILRGKLMADFSYINTPISVYITHCGQAYNHSLHLQ